MPRSSSRRRRDRSEEFREWRWATLTDPGSVRGAGSLLILATFGALLGALGVTIMILMQTEAQFDTDRRVALLLAAPALAAAMIVFFGTAPLFYKLHERWTRDDDEE